LEREIGRFFFNFVFFSLLQNRTLIFEISFDFFCTFSAHLSPSETGKDEQKKKRWARDCFRFEFNEKIWSQNPFCFHFFFIFKQQQIFQSRNDKEGKWVVCEAICQHNQSGIDENMAAA